MVGVLDQQIGFPVVKQCKLVRCRRSLDQLEKCQDDGEQYSLVNAQSEHPDNTNCKYQELCPVRTKKCYSSSANEHREPNARNNGGDGYQRQGSQNTRHQ